jgi:ABC-type Na+ efflux pump permease subunit
MSEKLILFVILGVIALVFVLVSMNHFKKKSSSWKGVVIDKGTREKVRNNTTNRNNSVGPNITIGKVSIGGLTNSNQRHVSISYFVVVKTDQGKEINWGISEGLYEKIKVGDEIEKTAGTMTPSIISS